jgi:DNA-binding response OmpR family regulator
MRRLDSTVPLIFIAVSGNENLAIAPFRAGVSDYFKKPVLVEELAVSIGHCLCDSLCRGSSFLDKPALSITSWNIVTNEILSAVFSEFLKPSELHTKSKRL